MDTSPGRSNSLHAATTLQRQHLTAQLVVVGLTPGGLPTVPLETLRHVLAVVHTAVAEYATPVSHPAVTRAWQDYARLAAAYLLNHTAPNPVLADEIVLRAQVIGWLARHYAQTQPVALLGLLYGLAEMLDKLAQILLPAGFAEAAPKASPWAAFSSDLQALALDASEQRQVSAAAGGMLGDLTGLVAALDPRVARPLRQLVGVLNPAAGKHLIPNDLREIVAAVAAGEQSWAEFPYYGWRYAGRGIRYTWSDSAWLVTLCALPQAEIDRQIAWLGQVLAARGMPRWLLERHLELLCAELRRTIPERAHGYAPLALAAQTLQAQRQQMISDELSMQLAAAFDAAVGPDLASRLPQTGWLLAAAVADERAGVPNALASLVDWLTDPARFPPAWITAVQQTVKLAGRRKRLASPRAPTDR